MLNTLKVLIIFLLFADYAQAQKAKQYHDSAELMMEHKMYNEAIPLYTRSIRLKPVEEMYYRDRGYAYFQVGKLVESKKDFRHALVLNPKCSNCYSMLGQVANEEGNADSALIYSNKAIEINDTSADAYISRAYIKEALKQVIGAERDFDKAISLKPNEWRNWLAKGDFYERGAIHEDAIACYSKAIKLNSNIGYMYEFRARSYLMAKKYDACLADLEEEKIKGIDNIDNWFNLRKAAYVALGTPEKLDAEVDESIAKGEGTYNLYYHRGIARFEKEDIDGACEDFNKAVELFMKSPEYKTNGMPDNIKEVIDERCDINKLGYYYHRGIASYNKNLYKSAIAYYDLGLKKFRNNALLMSFRGNANMALGNFKEAIIDYLVSISRKDELEKDASGSTNYKLAKPGEMDKNVFLVTNYESMAECYMYLGEFKRAGELFDSAITMEFSSPVLQSHSYSQRALNYFYKGDYSSSEKDLTKALSIDPKNAMSYKINAVIKLVRAQKISTKPYSIRAGGSFKDYIVFANNEILKATESNKNSEMLVSALDDINTSIEYGAQDGGSYYLRALIKKALESQDYCNDLYKAKELNYLPADEVIKTLCR